ncbi:DNA-binding transcriptional dual regulator NagC, partial [Salmonella enterica subsp. enterica serovar Heidelberg str. RI-11-013193]
QSRVPLDDCTIKTICKAANRGDSLASEVIEHVGRHLGKTTTANTVDFGASDAPLSDEKLDQEGLFQFPTVIGGVV